MTEDDRELHEFIWGSDATGNSKTVSAAELASWIGLTANRVNRLARDGKIPRASDKRFELQPAIRAYVETLREGQLGRTNSDPELKAAKVRQATAAAEKLELANAKLRGDLLDASEVQTTWTATVIDLRAALLAMPQRLSSTLGLDRRATQELDKEVREALGALADG